MAAKTLLLLRHAKSSWDDDDLDDFDRPLAGRGREAAPRIGREMARHGWIPDLALVSPALRTRQTFALIALELSRPPEIVLDRAIYEAPAARILAVLRTVPEEAATLLVVGHNPGLEDLTKTLASRAGDPDALARLGEKFPTAALACLACDGAWSDLGPGKARLLAFVTPRLLGGDRGSIGPAGL